MATYRINPVTLVTVIRNSANPYSKDFAVEIEQPHTVNWIDSSTMFSVRKTFALMNCVGSLLVAKPSALMSGKT